MYRCQRPCFVSRSERHSRGCRVSRQKVRDLAQAVRPCARRELDRHASQREGLHSCNALGGPYAQSEHLHDALCGRSADNRRPPLFRREWRFRCGCAIAAFSHQVSQKCASPRSRPRSAQGPRSAMRFRFQIVLWESVLPSMKGLRFVGGFYPSDLDRFIPYTTLDGKVVMRPSDPFRLDRGSGTFIGIEEKIFRRLAETARSGPLWINNLPRLRA